MMDLHKQRCDPDPSRISPLARRDLLDYIDKVPGWKISERKLTRNFDLGSFEECLDFLAELNDLSKREGHFPDVIIYNRKNLVIAWYTYESGGITRNDFIMAAKMNFSERFRV
jgi:4a-hydroxytetrahydrobiopterin dehydratase